MLFKHRNCTKITLSSTELVQKNLTTPHPEERAIARLQAPAPRLVGLKKVGEGVSVVNLFFLVE